MISATIHKRERLGPNGKKRVSWECVLELGADPVTGKRRQRSKSFARQYEAQDFRDQQIADDSRGALVKPSKMTMAQLMQQWLDTHQPNLKRHSYEGYEGIVRSHVVPGIGAILVQKLQPVDLQTFYNVKTKAGTSANVVGKCHLRIKQALGMAVNLGYISVNPADRVKPPRDERRELQTWTTEQGKVFLAEAEKSAYGPIWLFMLGSGLRIGEALGLRWCDVNLDRGDIRVVQSVSLAKDGIPYIDTPKTPQSRRPIGITPRLVAALTEHKAKQDERRRKLDDRWSDYDLVFPQNNGKPANANNLTRNYDIMSEKTGVERIRIHDLRHTHATWLREQGIDIKGVQDRLGHTQSSVTMDFYGHITPILDARTMEAVARAMSDI